MANTSKSPGPRGQFKRAQSVAASIDHDTAEAERLRKDKIRSGNWKRWGPYLSERQWGTVREDYSADGSWYETVHSFCARNFIISQMIAAGVTFLTITPAPGLIAGGKTACWDCQTANVVCASHRACGTKRIRFLKNGCSASLMTKEITEKM